MQTIAPTKIFEVLRCMLWIVRENEILIYSVNSMNDIKTGRSPGMAVHVCDPSTQEAEAGESWVWGQSGLRRELEPSLCYIVRHCLKIKGWGGCRRSTSNTNMLLRAVEVKYSHWYWSTSIGGYGNSRPELWGFLSDFLLPLKTTNALLLLLDSWTWSLQDAHIIDWLEYCGAQLHPWYPDPL
jgi:hypothetical protein